MKITVNKAKIKKLASFAKAAKNSTLFQKVNFYKGRAWATNGYTVFSCNYTAIDEPVRDILQIDAGALLEVIGKAGAKKEIEIDLDIFVFSSDALGALKLLFEGLMKAPPMAKISRMLWALLQPKGAWEHCNFLLTSDKIKAELYEKEENTDYCKNWIFQGGCELNEQNEIKTPLLLAISELKLQSIVKNKNACFSLVYHEKQNQYYLNYESEAGEIYVFCPQIEKLNHKGSNNHFSDEIKAAYKAAIDEMNQKTEPTTEPEPTNIEPEPDKEKEQMQPKKEIEPTEPTTAAEPIQNEEIQTSEPTSEKEGGGAPGWTGKADYQERREAKIERREERAAELRKEAERLRESVPDDWNYWTQPIHNTAGGRAFARSRQRELNKIDKSFEMDKKADYLESRGQSTAISSDDPEALDKLRAKLQALKENHEKLKVENKRRRQAGEEPFPWYTLQYSNRDIKRIEERIKELETRQNTTWKEYEFDGGRVVPNVSENRYQIFHDEKPEQSIIDFMKSHGWRWSKYNRCWQRLLNRETVRCIESSGKWGYIDYLPGLHETGAESEPEEPTQEPEQTTEPEPVAMQEGAEVVEPVEESQLEAAPVEITEEKEPEQIEPEPTEAGVLPMTDQLKLWGLPLDWERVQVIKHNAQESGLALMVYNTEGDGALFAMLPGFWAIVKERSKFDENSERFIRDNYDGVICYFDKDPEQAEMQEEPKAANPPIYTESVKWMEDAKTVSIPAPVVACKVDAPIQIPEPEPAPTTEEPDPEQIDKTKPTGAELRYSLSLLAMPYPIDTLIEKFLKKTNKPVRYSIVEKLLMTIDRGSVPKPGESKREYIKAYYQTH